MTAHDTNLTMGRALLIIVKWLLLGALALILLSAAGVGVYYIYQYFDYDVPASAVVSKVSHDPSICSDPNYPIFVGFVNNSDRTVLKARFRLAAYVPGHSTNRASYSFYTQDRILAPGEGFGSCWSVSFEYGYDGQAADMDWRIEDVTYTFD